MKLEHRRRTVLDDLCFVSFVLVLTWFVLMLITSFFV